MDNEFLEIKHRGEADDKDVMLEKIGHRLHVDFANLYMKTRSAGFLSSASAVAIRDWLNENFPADKAEEPPLITVFSQPRDDSADAKTVTAKRVLQGHVDIEAKYTSGRTYGNWFRLDAKTARELGKHLIKTADEIDGKGAKPGDRHDEARPRPHGPQEYRGNGKHDWETVNGGIDRMRVPGGWLYRGDYDKIVFVPMPDIIGYEV